MPRVGEPMDRSTELALVAHEMGGALAPARHALDLIRDGAPGALAADQARLLAIATRSLERADRLLQNLTALAAPESFAAQARSTPAGALLAGLCEAFAAEAAARGVRLEVETPEDLTVHTDRFCAEQALANLVSNALKFTPAGGSVTLAAAPAGTAVLRGRLALLGGGFGCKPRFVALEVRDTGVGVCDETRRRLFEPFFRGPEAARCSAPGLGLGLTAARRLVDLVHGQLRLMRSEPATGSRFVMTLPADPDTWSLLLQLDRGLEMLAPRLAAGPHTLVVLRRDAPPDAAAAPDDLGPDLGPALAEPDLGVLALSPTTTIVCARAGVRAVLLALARSLEARGGAAGRTGRRFHAQRTRRGAVADECLLRGLARCRHALPAPPAAREVLDVSNPARG
jgi:hypothetical protein